MSDERMDRIREACEESHSYALMILGDRTDELAAERKYTAELKADVLRLSTEVARLRKNMSDIRSEADYISDEGDGCWKCHALNEIWKLADDALEGEEE